MQRNIKLGPGGIREIRFIGQAFQLIYGGRDPMLRERGILAVWIIWPSAVGCRRRRWPTSKQAYVFLRRVENRLQAWADRQTHDLPDNELAQLRLARDGANPTGRYSPTVGAARSGGEPAVRSGLRQRGDRCRDPQEKSWRSYGETGQPGEEGALRILAEHGFETSIGLESTAGAENGFSYRAMSPAQARTLGRAGARRCWKPPPPSHGQRRRWSAFSICWKRWPPLGVLSAAGQASAGAGATGQAVRRQQLDYHSSDSLSAAARRSAQPRHALRTAGSPAVGVGTGPATGARRRATPKAAERLALFKQRQRVAGRRRRRQRRDAHDDRQRPSTEIAEVLLCKVLGSWPGPICCVGSVHPECVVDG